MERGLIAIATAISVLAGCTTGIGEGRVFASAVFEFDHQLHGIQKPFGGRSAQAG